MSEALKVVVLQALTFLLDQQIRNGDVQASSQARQLSDGLVEVKQFEEAIERDLAQEQKDLAAGIAPIEPEPGQPIFAVTLDGKVTEFNPEPPAADEVKAE